MLLVIDIGNTNTTLGIFNKDELIESFSVASDQLKTSDEYGVLLYALLSKGKIYEKIKACVISSVVPTIEETIKTGVMKFLNISPYVISHKSKLPFKIDLEEPKEAGADRLANAAAASILYKLPSIVIDIGTATTFDIVDENKNFRGGIIAPGPVIQAKSLSKFTSKLPKLKIEAPKNHIGRNTIDAMLSGIVTGHLKMIEGMIEACEKELGARATIIGTGGLSNVLFGKMKRDFDYIDPKLTLKGVKIIWELNNGAEK